jgi:hypothetical protein
LSQVAAPGGVGELSLLLLLQAPSNASAPASSSQRTIRSSFIGACLACDSMVHDLGVQDRRQRRLEGPQSDRIHWRIFIEAEPGPEKVELRPAPDERASTASGDPRSAPEVSHKGK